MPTTVNIHEAKTHLSRLLESVAAGGEVIIARAGRPRARLSAYTEEPPRRRFGQDAGLVELALDFNEPLPPAWVLGSDSDTPD